jgi:hypothetical protein
MLNSIFLMDQCSFKLYLSPKGLSRIEIHSNLTETLGAEAIAYSTLTRYLHKINITDLIEMKESRST